MVILKRLFSQESSYSTKDSDILLKFSPGFELHEVNPLTHSAVCSVAMATCNGSRILPSSNKL